MHYDDEQVNRMIYELQYLQLAREKSAATFIDKLLQDARELQPILYVYPLVWYEPLDYHYILLKYLSALGRELLVDLCSGHYTWRGIVLACWLTCLRPQADFEEPLRAALGHTPIYNKWFIELALAEIQGVSWRGNRHLQRSIQELRSLLSKIMPPNFSLRPAFTATEIEQLNIERNQIMAAYRVGGTSAAKLAIAGTLYQSVHGQT